MGVPDRRQEKAELARHDVGERLSVSRGSARDGFSNQIAIRICQFRFERGAGLHLCPGRAQALCIGTGAGDIEIRPPTRLNGESSYGGETAIGLTALRGQAFDSSGLGR